MQYMKGSSLPPEVLSKFENLPARPKFISNLSATKTGFHTNHKFKDFEFKKENLLEIIEA